MVDAAFDTLAVTRQLKARGFDADQAEAITEAVRAGVTGGVATKADLAELRVDMSELRAGVAEVRTELRWMKAAGGVIVAALVWLGVQAYETNATLAEHGAAIAEVQRDMAEVKADMAEIKALLAAGK